MGQNRIQSEGGSMTNPIGMANPCFTPSDADIGEYERHRTNDQERRKMAGEYWVCIIGPVEEGWLPLAADAPLRNAALAAYIRLLGFQPECWSGWGVSEAVKEKILDVWLGR